MSPADFPDEDNRATCINSLPAVTMATKEARKSHSIILSHQLWLWDGFSGFKIKEILFVNFTFSLTVINRKLMALEFYNINLHEDIIQIDSSK